MLKTSPNRQRVSQTITALLLLVCILLTPFQKVSAQDETPASSGPVYLVQTGDTLFVIAMKFGVTVDDLLSVNDLENPNILSTGQEIVIPGLEGVSGVLMTEVIPLGDTLRTLSIRYQITPEQVMNLNRITSPTEVFAGASLIIPQKEETTPPQGRYLLESSQSLMQLAVANQQNPWLLAEINQMDSPWALLPGDPIFASPDPNVKEMSLVSPLVESLEISPLPLMQGSTIAVKVSSPEPMEISGTLAGNSLRFFRDDEGQYVALQGIHAMAAPGITPITLEGTLLNGQKFSFEQMVVLQAAGYAREDIQGVDPVTLASENTKPEDDQVKAIISQISSEQLWDGPFLVPGYDPNWITSWYGTRRSYNGGPYSYFHTGVDYGGGTGLEIKSPAAGVVVFAGPLTVRGNATIIDHGWGVFSGFWHQSEFKVQVGDRVEPGQVIGLIGGTGRVTGAHLHWEIWVNGIQVEPLDWLYTSYP